HDRGRGRERARLIGRGPRRESDSMNHLRSIEEVAETLQNAKARGKGCTLLIGAGCSVKAGIPIASGFVQIIKDRYPRAYQRAEKKTYPTCMSELLLSE